jgi:hypothetical protein
MPADFIIDLERGVVFTKAVGDLVPADMWGHRERLLAHPDFRPELNQLMDLRDCSPTLLTAEQLLQLARPRVYSVASRRALLVSSDLQYGLSRMFETYCELEGETFTRVFRSEQEALDFLGITAVPPRAAFALLASAGG